MSVRVFIHSLWYERRKMMALENQKLAHCKRKIFQFFLMTGLAGQRLVVIARHKPFASLVIIWRLGHR